MFHRTNLGMYGNLPSDMDGYVPEDQDGPWDFNIDHGSERTHDENGELTEYGEWWENEGFPEWKAEAIASTAESEKELDEWRHANVF